jgi:hypothetical protein
MKDSDGWGKGESDSRYNKFIFGVGIVNSWVTWFQRWLC